MPIPSSGVSLSFGTLADNKSSSSRADLSLQNLSKSFASGSQVGNVDGSGAANQPADRSALNSSPYALSEFYDAEFGNEFFDTVLLRNTADTTTLTDTVDAEGVKIKWTVPAAGGTAAPSPSAYTVGLKLKSNDTVVAGSTGTLSDGTTGVKTVAITTPNNDGGAGGAANYWYPFVKTTEFLQAVGSDLTHYNKLGTITITNPGSPSHTVAAHTTTQAITQTHTQETATYGAMTAGIGYAWTFARDGTTSTDGTANPSPTTSTTATQAVTYTGPGVYTSALTVTANPSTRNTSAAATISHTIHYTDAVTINSISNVNEGSTVTVAGTAKGFTNGITRGLVASTATSTFIATKSSDDTSNSLYVSDSHTTTFSVPTQTSTTGVYQGRVVDRDTGTVSANTSNFNVYPTISDEFASGDISATVDPVLVGANTVLSVGNVSDNITGYAWAMTSGTGTFTATSGTLTGGGSGGDTTTIINEQTAATVTVTFNAAQSSKTIRLTLQGRLLQSDANTKTLSVELADAVTINNPSDVNEGATITISGTQAGLQYGARFGIVTDGGGVFDVSATPNYRDSDPVESRYTSGTYTGTFAVPSQGSTYTDYDAYVRGVTVSTVNARSNTFRVYPTISEQFSSGNISATVDPVIVSTGTSVLSVTDITNTITSYAWVMTSGTGTMTSTNQSAGDAGTSTQAIIDLSDTATNTVTFSTAQSSKTITLTLRGRLSQTTTATKTISVELADAVTVNNASSVNEGSDITVSGTHAGLHDGTTNGVQFGIVADGASTFLVSDTDDNDSRYSSVAYSNSTISVPAQTDTTTAYDTYVKPRSTGATVTARGNTFSVFPLISQEFAAGDITVTNSTVYQTSNTPSAETDITKRSVFTFANNVTDNVTGYTYTATYTSGTGTMTSTNASDGTQTTDSNATTAVMSLATGTAGASGSNVVTFSGAGTATVTINIAGRIAQRESVTKTITINYKPEFTSMSITSGTSNVVPSSAITWTTVWQGFAATIGADITLKTINNSTGATIASQTFSNMLGADYSYGALGTQTTKTSTDLSPGGTAPGSTLTAPSTAGLAWKMRASYSGVDDQDSTVATNLTVHSVSVYHSIIVGPYDRAYSSYVDAADDKNTNSFSNYKTAHWGSPTGDSTAPVGTEWHTSSTLSTDFDGTNNANDGGGSTLYYNVGLTSVKLVAATASGTVAKGEITAVKSPVPPVPTAVTSVATTATTRTVSLTGNTTVARTYRIYYGSTAGSTSNNVTGNVTQGTSVTTTHGSTIDVSSFGGGNVYFTAQHRNGRSAVDGVKLESGAYSVTSPVREIVTSAGTTTTDQWTSEIDAYKYSEGVVLTLTNTQSNDQMLITATHSGATPVNLTLKMGANKTNGTAPYASNGAAPGGTGGQETSNITSTATLTFSSLSSGTNYFTVMMEGLSDHAWGSAFGTTTFTISALVKDSGGSTVLASANFFTWLAREFTD